MRLLSINLWGCHSHIFGDPNSQGVEQDAKACVEMAIAMRQQMKLLRERWKKWVTQHCISEWALVLVIAT